MDVERFNSEVGTLSGYDCPICKNKGMVAVYQDGEDKYKPCSCMEIRRIYKIQDGCGIGALLNRYTFGRYRTDEHWQRKTLEMAEKYANEMSGWFYISGRSGTGKTHICTAIIKALMQGGIVCKYMIWREEAQKIKALANTDQYAESVKDMKEAKCLYIDDFLKGNVTQGDTNLAYDIINHRYNANLPTIFSSEKNIREVLEIDEAIGGRIYEMTMKGKNSIDLKNVQNYRLRG